MRRAILLGLLTVIALPCCAAKRDAVTQVTVAQLEHALTTASAEHKPDAAIVRMIGGMKLSERLTDVSLERLSALLQTGSQAALALRLLADQSAFLDPPASELPSTPAPSDAAQRQLLTGARIYVAQTLRHLPNFLATRTVKRFDDNPETHRKGAWRASTGLYLVGSSSREVSTRSEHDNQFPSDQLSSWGEFGSAVGMALKDAAQGTVTWSHWEETPAGTAAVFHYSVPKSASHFQVNPAEFTESGLSQGIMSGYGNPEAVLQPTRSASFYNLLNHVNPGYHGSFWLDPSTGAVLRITMEADPKDTPYRIAAMMVQYGRVRIGDGDFICPLRGLSLLETSTRQLNETLFTGYHHFNATVRVLSDTDTPH